MSFAVVTRPARCPLGVAAQPVDLGSPERDGGPGRPACRQFGAERPQCCEKLLRPADPGKSQQTRAGEPLAGDRRQHGVQHWNADRSEMRQAARVHIAAEQHDSIGAGKAPPEALAQRPRRDHPAIAKAVAGIDDDQRQILGEPGFCSPSSSNDHAGAGRGRGAHAGGAVARHPARRSRGKQQRLVADRGGIMRGPDRPAPARRGARHSRGSRYVPRCRVPRDHAASASTTGVLPAPPATRLPTHTTGTGAR